jgi:hypothetical protein
MLSVENVYFYPKRYRTDQQRAEEHNSGRRRGNDSLPVTLENELERNEAVDAHMRLWKSDGDHFTLLNIYNKWADAGEQEIPSCSSCSLRACLTGCTLSWCETSFIRFSAMKLAKSIRFG